MTKSEEEVVLSASARGATYLVLLQISSRGFTFVVNQVLLRYLSPELLGISSQLELFAISVLYFSRESLRVALQRQGNRQGIEAVDNDQNQAISPTARRAQEVVNLTYIPITLGPLLAYLFSSMYLSRATSDVLAVPHIQSALTMYSAAAVLELCVEPCFAVANQQMRYGLRASAETVATLTRCLLTCSTAIWGSSTGQSLGALPFAFGQIGYAAGLILVYYGSVLRKAAGFSLIPHLMSDNNHVLSLFSRPILSLALNLYAQSGLKHILTQGDGLLNLFTDLTSQGVYALASNYGSLLARVLFSPIEESSRGVFGRLLSSPSPSPQHTQNPDDASNITPSDPDASPTIPLSSLKSAHKYLTTLLRAYSLLGLLLTTLAPSLASPLLSLVAGRAWRSTAAPRVLSLYCYYLPLLAYNGILEAFVAAVATPKQLRTQSAWMLAFSAAYISAGWVLLGLWGMGAEGLVGANAVNMLVRIVWCAVWVEGWWREQKELRRSQAGTASEKGGKEKVAEEVPDFKLLSEETLPRLSTVSAGVAGLAALGMLKRQYFDGSWRDLVLALGVAGIAGLSMLWSERDLAMELYRTVRPGSTKVAKDTSNEEKKKR